MCDGSLNLAEEVHEYEPYKYRDFPCTICDKDEWCVSGKDTLKGSGGVLEWCYNEEDAIERLKIMQQYAQFEDLSIGKFQDQIVDM